jgi:hypothetical protein
VHAMDRLDDFPATHGYPERLDELEPKGHSVCYSEGWES